MSEQLTRTRVIATLFLIIALLTACKKEKQLSLSTLAQGLYPNDKFILDVSPDRSGCTFESENDFVATVSSTGEVTAHLVGETKIIVKNTAKDFYAECNISVWSKYGLFREPYLDFKDYVPEIKAYEDRYLYGETDSMLIYVGENSKIEAVFYYLVDQYYVESMCVLPEMDDADLDNFLNERYYYLGTDGVFITMMTTDTKTLVGIRKDVELDSYIYNLIYYIPNSETKSKLFTRLLPELKGIKKLK